MFNTDWVGFSWQEVFPLLGFSPRLFDEIAQYLGVAYPPVIALALAISLLVIKILGMDIERSHIEIRNQRLIQRVAMLEADLRKAQKQFNSDDESPTTCESSEIHDGS